MMIIQTPTILEYEIVMAWMSIDRILCEYYFDDENVHQYMPRTSSATLTHHGNRHGERYSEADEPWIRMGKVFLNGGVNPHPGRTMRDRALTRKVTRSDETSPVLPRIAIETAIIQNRTRKMYTFSIFLLAVPL